MVIRRFAEGPPQRVDVEAQISFLDETVGPDAPHQFFLAHYLAVALDQGQQHVESLRLERNDRAVTQQQSFHLVQAEWTELVSVCHRSLRRHAKKKKERLRGSLRTMNLLLLYLCPAVNWR